MYLPAAADLSACIINNPADNDLIYSEVGIYFEPVMYNGPDIPALSMNISSDGYPAAAIALQPQR